MNNKLIIGLLGVAVVIVGIFAFTNNNDSNTKSADTNEVITESITPDTCVSEDCLKVDGLEYPVDSLPNEIAVALDTALDDEYKARATYEAVIDQFGSVRPFSMIIRAEEQHISSLKALYDKYGLDIPNDPYSNVEIASTKSENCTVGVQAEIDNAALYRESLLPAVEGYPDIVSVFTNLMNASQNNHLPAFEKCAS